MCWWLLPSLVTLLQDEERSSAGETARGGDKCAGLWHNDDVAVSVATDNEEEGNREALSVLRSHTKPSACESLRFMPLFPLDTSLPPSVYDRGVRWFFRVASSN